ncbi:MAG: hypothetical protein M3R61_14395 [Chloroflexota bacterium]|nr:hypothetical protein [Chloroflexota bacterium]
MGLGGQQAIAEFTQHREIKPGVGQLQAKGVFPINGPAHAISGLAVGQAFHKREDGHQQQATGRQGGLPDGGKHGGEVQISTQHAQFVADLHDRTALGKGGAGDPLGFGGNDVKELRLQAHVELRFLPDSAWLRAKCSRCAYRTASTAGWEAQRSRRSFRWEVRQQYPKALGWRYEAHLRGLDMCSINLTTTEIV